MRPGSKVVPGRSITCASAERCTALAGPAATMRSPRVSTTQPSCTGSPALHTRAGRSRNERPSAAGFGAGGSASAQRAVVTVRAAARATGSQRSGATLIVRQSNGSRAHPPMSTVVSKLSNPWMARA